MIGVALASVGALANFQLSSRRGGLLNLAFRNQYLWSWFAGGVAVASAMQLAMNCSFSGCLRGGVTCSAARSQAVLVA